MQTCCPLCPMLIHAAYDESGSCSSGNSLASKDALKPYASQVFGRARIKPPADTDGILVAVVCATCYALITRMQWRTNVVTPPDLFCTCVFDGNRIRHKASPCRPSFQALWKKAWGSPKTCFWQWFWEMYPTWSLDSGISQAVPGITRANATH